MIFLTSRLKFQAALLHITSLPSSYALSVRLFNRFWLVFLKVLFKSLPNQPPFNRKYVVANYYLILL